MLQRTAVSSLVDLQHYALVKVHVQDQKLKHSLLIHNPQTKIVLPGGAAAMGSSRRTGAKISASAMGRGKAEMCGGTGIKAP